MGHERRIRFWLAALLVLALVAAACTNGGVSQDEFDKVTQQLADRTTEVEGLQQQLATAGGAAVVQAGQLAPAVEGAAPTGWDTEESMRGGLQLFATYDASGPDAWDVAAHPVVYFTSEGRGYGHRPSETNQLPGVQVIDAYTYETVASALFDLGGEPVRQPHGLGASPDGQWVYIGFAQEAGEEEQNLTLVINARTLKLDKVLRQESPFESGTRSQNLHHIGGFVDYAGNDRVVLDYGFGASGGPHFILDPTDDNRVVRAITYDDVKPMGHPYTAVSPDGRYMYISVGADWIREAEGFRAAIAKLNLEDGSVTYIEGVGSHPIGIAHTSDGAFTYVADGTNSFVFKIDNETNEVVGHTSAAVAGPYGLRLSWDEATLYVDGKGEGSHNTGGGVGVIDTATFQANRALNQPINTGGAIIDHLILHPDPEVNELWISSAGTFETIVVDLDANEVKARIPTPNGGDTHSGAFVRYNVDGAGELLIDMLGPGRPMFAQMNEFAQMFAADEVPFSERS